MNNFQIKRGSNYDNNSINVNVSPKKRSEINIQPNININIAFQKSESDIDIMDMDESKKIEKKSCSEKELEESKEFEKKPKNKYVLSLKNQKSNENINKNNSMKTSNMENEIKRSKNKSYSTKILSFFLKPFKREKNSKSLNSFSLSEFTNKNSNKIYKTKEKYDKKGYISYCYNNLNPIESNRYRREIWIKNLLVIAFYVKKFVNKLKNSIDKGKLTKINKYHYSIIHDNAHKYETNNEKGFKSQLKDEYKNIVQVSHTHKLFIFTKKAQFYCKLYLLYCISPLLNMYFGIKTIEPDGKVKIFWDFLILFLTVFKSFYIPLKLGFNLNGTVFTYYCLELFPLICFILDILIAINTAYYSKGAFIAEKRKIFKNYIKHHIFMDLFEIIPLILSITTNKANIEVLYLIQILRLSKLSKKLEDYLQMPEKLEGMFRLLKLLFLVIYTAHICGCIWHYLALLNISFGYIDTWLHVNKLMSTSWYERYVNALYFSVLTMITVGYVQTDSFMERCISIVLVLILSGMFAYSINCIGLILGDMSKNSAELKNKLREINHYMKRRGINTFLQVKIRKYFEYMQEEEKMGSQRGGYLLNFLSKNLKDELNMDSYSKLFSNIKLFNMNFSGKFLKKLSTKVIEMTFAPEETIYQPFENENGFFYIISGSIEISYCCQKEIYPIEILNV